MRFFFSCERTHLSLPLVSTRSRGTCAWPQAARSYLHVRFGTSRTDPQSLAVSILRMRMEKQTRVSLRAKRPLSKNAAFFRASFLESHYFFFSRRPTKSRLARRVFSLSGVPVGGASNRSARHSKNSAKTEKEPRSLEKRTETFFENFTSDSRLRCAKGRTRPTCCSAQRPTTSPCDLVNSCCDF